MSCILQITFPHDGPWGEQLTDQFRPLAMAIADEPGLIWKIWTENPDTKRSGGVYMFNARSSAEAYLTAHTTRLQAAGVTTIDSEILDVNNYLSRLDRAPI